MKHLNKILATTILTVGLSFSAFAKDKDQVVANVNGQPIMKSEVAMLAQALPPQVIQQQKDPQKLFEGLVDQLIDMKVLIETAKKANLEKRDDVKQAIEKATENVLVQAYMGDQMKTAVTDSAVRAKYDELIKQFPKDAMETKARHILVKDEAKAKAIIKQLKGGADFLKLAREHSEDKATAPEGGDLGFFRQEDMVPEFSKAVADIEPGKYSTTPIKTTHGYHVAKVDQRRKIKAPSFDEAKEKIKALLAQEKMLQVVKKLRDAAKVEKFDVKA